MQSQLSQYENDKIGKEHIFRFFQAFIDRQLGQPLNAFSCSAGCRPDPQSLQQGDESEKVIQTHEKQCLQQKPPYVKDRRVEAKKIPYGQYQYPYCSIGYLLSIFELEQSKPKYTVGTGSLIQSNIVLTATQNIYDEKLQKEASAIYFYPSLNGKIAKRAFAVEKSWFYEKFSCEGDNQEKNKDSGFAVLKLKQKSIAKVYGYLGFDTDHQKLKYKQILIYGYPIQKQAKFLKHQFGMKGRIEKFDDQRFYYNINAASGSPIIYEDQNGDYRIVGVHIFKDDESKMNVGLRFTQNIKTQINYWTKQIKNKPKMKQQIQESEMWDQMQELIISKEDIQKYCQKIEKEGISDAMISVLTKQTKCQFKKVETLSLIDLNLTDRGLINLVYSQEKFKLLEYLNLSNNKIENQNDSLEYLTRNQNVFKQLRQLYLGSNKIGNEGVEHLTRNQNMFKHLFHLQLSNNQIGNQGIEQLTRNQQVFKYLRILQLNDNQIGNNGIKHLTRNQNVFKHLYHLQLSDNKLEKDKRTTNEQRLKKHFKKIVKLLL